MEGAAKQVLFETGCQGRRRAIQDFNGVVECGRKGKLRVLISIFGRATRSSWSSGREGLAPRAHHRNEDIEWQRKSSRRSSSRSRPELRIRARRTSARTAPREHHGVLQGLRAGQGTVRPHHPGDHHRVRGPAHLHHEDATASILLLRAAGLAKDQTGRSSAGTIARARCEIAETKLVDLTAGSLDAATRPSRGRPGA
jgi:hypothetical protein